MYHNHKRLWLAILTAFALSLNAASATFEITAFSCNGQGNPAVVESGSAMNCVARIYNNDLQNSATVGTVTLAVSGGWAEQSTYAVVVSESVGAGSSEDVTFQSIRSITPGDAHAFSYVDIDGTAYTTTVSSYAVNALAIKSLTATSPVSSASTSSAFDISSTVRAGGNFLSMTLAIGLSGGCSLGSGQSASKSMGAMSNNAQTSTSWTVTQGSSDCAVTVTATGTSSPVTVTSSKSVTVTNPGGGSTTSTAASAGAGSGGSGAGGAGSAAVSKYIGELGLSKVTQKLALGETMKFALLSVNHTIAVKNITLTNATIEVNSTPQVATLLVGETKKFDLGSDGGDDISVMLSRIENWEAELVIQLISPEAIKKIEEAEKKKVPESTATTTPGAAVTTTPLGGETPGEEGNAGPVLPSGGNVLYPVLRVLAVAVVLAAAAVFVYRRRYAAESGKKRTKEIGEIKEGISDKGDKPDN